jgi:hypothetical protein
MTAPRLSEVYGRAGALQFALNVTFREARLICWLLRDGFVVRRELHRFDPDLGRIYAYRLRTKLGALGVELTTRHGVGYAMPEESRKTILAIIDAEFASSLDAESAPEYVSEHAR